MSHRRKLTDEQKAEQKAEQSKMFDDIIDSFIDEIEVTTSSEEDKPEVPVEKPSLKKPKSLDDIFQ